MFINCRLCTFAVNSDHHKTSFVCSPGEIRPSFAYQCETARYEGSACSGEIVWRDGGTVTKLPETVRGREGVSVDTTWRR